MAAKRRPLIRAKDESQDRSYFVIAPQLVWALCENVYQFTLWTVIKMIAGEEGECTLHTDDLAALAMMSTGKCQAAREALMRLGLIEGRLYRDPGYRNAVWHLRVPDVWAANQEWRERHHALEGRVAFKRAQRQRQSRATHSPGEPVHQVNASRAQGTNSSGETKKNHARGTNSPGETKKNHDHDPRAEDRDLALIWERAVRELEMQVTKVTFGQWIRPLALASVERQEGGARAAIRCPNAYVREWCATRLDVLIRRTLGGILGVPVAVAYLVAEE